MLAIFDGSIFNTDELGAKPSANPARILLDTHRQRGFRAAIEAINGDFACALFDAAAGVLCRSLEIALGTGRCILPITGERSPLRSLPAALIGLPEISPAINKRYAAVFGGSHYRYIDNRPDELPFRDISQLAPATLLCVRDDAIRAERYWDLREHEEWRGSEQELALQYRDLLLDWVRRLMAATSAYAFMLLGGLDSSSVTAVVVLASVVLSSTHFRRSIATRLTTRARISKHFRRIRFHNGMLSLSKILTCWGRWSVWSRATRNRSRQLTWLSHFLLCEEVSRAGFRTLFGGSLAATSSMQASTNTFSIISRI